MDITPTTTIMNNNNNAATPPAIAAAATSSKSPEHETETPPRIAINTTPATKALSFSNGVLKRHHHSFHHPHLLANHTTMAPVAYKECLKNHAANLGGHALDGCGEFMPAPTATSADPSSLKCAACGCHRNFHRREPEEPPISTTAVIEYQPHHRHHPPPPPSFQPSSRSPNSASPPPISSSYYPSAPHMLLALSTGLAAPPENAAGPTSSSSRKRFRTKFSQEQKEKMLRFAEKVGWKMQKRDDDFVQEFCSEIGIERGVLKVWMHNNKNTFGKRDGSNDSNNNNNAGSAKSFLVKENHDPVNSITASDFNGNGNPNNGAAQNQNNPIHHYQSDGGATVRANGSSSS